MEFLATSRKRVIIVDGYSTGRDLVREREPRLLLLVLNGSIMGKDVPSPPLRNALSPTAQSTLTADFKHLILLACPAKIPALSRDDLILARLKK